MIQKSTAHLLALRALKPRVVAKDLSTPTTAIIVVEIHDDRFAMYEIRRRNLGLGDQYFEYAGSIVGASPNKVYFDEGAQINHALQFTVTGFDSAGNPSSATVTNVVQAIGV